MTRAFLSIALCLCAVVAGAAERMPSDTHWAIQIDVQKALASQLGSTLNIKQHLNQATIAKLRMVEAITGFNPWRDLRSITICGADASGDSGVIMVRGTFNAEKLVLPVQANEGYVATPAGQRTIHSWKGDKPAAACLVQPDLLVITKTTARILAVIAALDASDAPQTGITLPSTSNGTLLAAGVADNFGAMIPDGPQAELIRTAHGMSATISEEGGALVLQAHAIAAEETQAQQLLDAGRGLIAFTQLAKMEDVDPALATAVRGIQLDRKGTKLTLHMTLPIADIQRIIIQKKILEQ